MWLQRVGLRDLMVEECGNKDWGVLWDLYTFSINHHMTLFDIIWQNQQSQLTITAPKYIRDKTVAMHQAY
jgi:hypothetical protein